MKEGERGLGEGPQALPSGKTLPRQSREDGNQHVYPGTAVPNLVTVNCVIWGRAKRENPESLQEKITATVFGQHETPCYNDNTRRVEALTPTCIPRIVLRRRVHFIPLVTKSEHSFVR